MAFAELKYPSPSLQKAMAADLILPDPGVEPPYATLYLLHGLSDDHTIWQRRTSIERYVAGSPLIVVMPDSGRGFYTDAEEGPAWETSIVSDLLTYIDTLFPTVKEASGRCVAGLSMGGYGAVKFALKHPNLFSAGATLSGAVAFAHRPLSRDRGDAWFAEFARVVGPDPEGGPNDLFALAEQFYRTPGPALSIDCGTEDFLIDANREFHQHLEALGYAHEYAEHPGAHEWGYWDLHIQDALRFFKAHVPFLASRAPAD